jgi:hypothetical protein
LKVVRRCQLIEPLPESAQGVLDLLNDAIQRGEGEAVVCAEVQDADPQAMPPHKEVMEERIARQHAAFEAPTRSYERTREPEPAAAAHATALVLAADLAAAQAAVAAEQRRTRDLGLALAEKNAVAEASRTRVNEILRDYERIKSEMHTLRESLEARDTTIVEMRHSLDVGDTQLAELRQEHAKVVSTLEARAETGAQLEADLQAALARADAISLELTVGQEAAVVLNAKLKRGESRLNAALTELDAVKTQSSSYLELIRTREWRRGFDHNMIRELDAQVRAANVRDHALESARDRALLPAEERTTSDAQSIPESKEAADLRQAEQATQIAQLHAEQASQIERLQAEADQRKEEMGILMAQLQEARRPAQAFEADLKRLTEELAAKDRAAAMFDEEDRKLSAILEWTRGALEECEFIIRRLERSDSNNANVLGRIQTSVIERLKSVSRVPVTAAADPGGAASGATDRSAELIRIDGEQTTAYVLAKRTRIGRAPACELQIDSRSVSRHHAIIMVGRRYTIIEDLNSTNGVQVNGRKVTRRVMRDGDALTIGDARFRYFARRHDGPPGPHPAECVTPRNLIP